MGRTGNVRVCLRVRPLNEWEQQQQQDDDNSDDDDDDINLLRLNKEKNCAAVLNKNNDTQNDFTFDRVYDNVSKQKHIYRDMVQPLVNDFVAGRNCCVFAYGQSGSGKTYSMMGPYFLNQVIAHIVKEKDDEEEDAAADDGSIKSGISSLGSAGVSVAKPQQQRQQQELQQQHGDTSGTPLPDKISCVETKSGHPPLHPSMGGMHRRDPNGNNMSDDIQKSNNSTSHRSSKHRDKRIEIDNDSGIVPRVIHDVFNAMKKKKPSSKSKANEEPILRCSFVEVYTEQIYDLLSSRDAGSTTGSDYDSNNNNNNNKARPIIREANGGTIEPTVRVCKYESDIYNIIHEGITTRNVNAKILGREHASSRSNTILILKYERYSRSKGKRTTSNFFLSDLADSELVRQTTTPASSANSDDKLIFEAKTIKKSLGALRKCLHSLALSGRSSTSRGDSNFTQLLHSGLQKGAGTAVIITASPFHWYIGETLSALKFGVYVAGQSQTTTTIAGGRAGQSSSSIADSRQSSSEARRRDKSRRGKSEEQESTDATSATASRKNKDRQKGSHYHADEDDTKKTMSTEEDRRVGASKAGTFVAPPSSSSSQGYRDLEVASELLRNKASTASVKSSRSGGNKSRQGTGDMRGQRHHDERRLIEEQQDSDDRGEFTTVSTLLRSAAKQMEADLSVAKEELHSSNLIDIRNVETVEEMEEHLETARKELEMLQVDGLDVSSQIEKDLDAAHDELIKIISEKREGGEGQHIGILDTASIDTGRRRNHHNKAPHNKGAESDFALLQKELEALKTENMRLVEGQKSRDKELAIAKKKIEVLTCRAGESEELFDIPADSGEEYQNEVENPVEDEVVEIVKEDNKWPEMDEDKVGPSPVRVCLRLRPMTKIETSRRSRSCIEVHEGSRGFTVDSPLDGEYDFFYDHVFDTHENQETVYGVVGTPIVNNLFSGINSCVIIYGLSGSGKAHTIMGSLPNELDSIDPDDPDADDIDSVATVEFRIEEESGVTPRLIGDIFKRMRSCPETIAFRVSCSFVAIYLEKMFDLLEPQIDKTLYVVDETSGVRIEGASEAYCFDETDIISLIHRGNACRSILGTRLNIDPARSHSIFVINIEKRDLTTGIVQRSYLHLTKLAAFEVQSKAKGQSIQETKLVHKSFSALGNVIKTLTEGNANAPYRESKLTCVLRDALGGNCKTTFIITASPSSYNISETINTIRLGQRVRRVINDARANLDGSSENYRKWLILTETKLGELTGFVKEMASKLIDLYGNDREDCSDPLWESLSAVVDEEEIESNPCRTALVLCNDEELRRSAPKWRTLSLELAKRMPSDELTEVVKARDRAESLLSDIQSEVVVLRRQNELLVQDKRKKDAELAEAKRDSKLCALKNAELEHKLGLAEGRAKEATIFLRYMRSLCWDLQRDIELDRPVNIAEITTCLSGAPDLTGLVDLDSLMMDSGFIKSRDRDEAIEDEFTNHITQSDGREGDDDGDEEDDDIVIDQLAGLDESIRSGSERVSVSHSTRGSRRLGTSGSSHHSRTRHGTGRLEHGWAEPHEEKASILNALPSWMRSRNSEAIHEEEMLSAEESRYSRRERELQNDLRTMTSKCVDLQMLLNAEQERVEALSRSGAGNKNRQAQETLTLVKDRDRMTHNAKAATWKLQELHVVNKVLARQAASSKQQVTFLEEGFQRLQETFRTTVLDSLDADSQLRDRVDTLQAMVDSLTGPREDEDAPDYEQLRTAPRINVPIRGQLKKRKTNDCLIDPSSKDSAVRCLMLTAAMKNSMKTPVMMIHRFCKHPRRSRKNGNAFLGSNKDALRREWQRQRRLVPPSFEVEGDIVPNATMYRRVPNERYR